MGVGIAAHITSSRVFAFCDQRKRHCARRGLGTRVQGTAECTGNFHILLKPSHHVSPIGSFPRVSTPMLLRPVAGRPGLSHSLISAKHVSNLFVRLSTNFLNTVAAHFQTRRSSAQHTATRGRCRLVQPAIYPGLPRLFNHTNSASHTRVPHKQVDAVVHNILGHPVDC